MTFGKKNLKLTLSLLLIAVFVMFLIFDSFPSASAQSNSTGQSNPSLFPLTQVNVTQIVSPHYTVFDPAYPETVVGNVQLTAINFTSPQIIQIITSYNPSIFSVNDTLENYTTIPIYPSVQQVIASGAAFSFFLSFPAGSFNVSMLIEGIQTGVGMLWKFVTNTPFIEISGSNLSPSYQNFALVPSHSRITEAFAASTASHAGSQLPVPNYVVAGSPPGYVSYYLPPDVGTVILQSTYYLPVSVILILLATILVILSALQMIPSGRKIVARVFHVGDSIFLVRIKSIISKFNNMISAVTGSNIPLSRRLFSKERITSKEVLIYFILCGILMVGIAAMFGPNPAVQAYVVSQPYETGAVQQNLNYALGGNVQIVTPQQDYTDFNVMSSVGQFNLAVISSFPSFSIAEVSTYVLGNLGNVPVIVIDNSTDPTLAQEITYLYPTTVLKVNNSADLSSGEMQEILSRVQASKTHNLLGLNISYRGFEIGLTLEAGLSFLLIFLGGMYLGVRAVEPGNENTLTRIAFMIAAGVFVFYFGEVVYVATSATLEFPLSLHAVLSGAQDITAVGVFGRVLHLPLGGGSTPRLLSGVLGVLVGSLYVAKSKLFSFRSTGLILGVVVLLIVNPFSLGSFVYQSLLLFVGNIPLGAAYASSLTFKGFLYGIGSGLGGSVTPTFLMSAGKISYFAGLVPAAFVKKMRKVTASLTILVCAVLLGDGGVRIGEMTPDKTVIGVLPGVIAGFVIASVFLAASLVENFLVSRHVKGTL